VPSSPYESAAARVGNRVRLLREAKGLSIRELSRRSGLAPQVLSRTERAMTEITITSLGRICEALGLTLPEFFEEDAVPHHPEFRSPAAQRAAKVLAALPPEQANRVAHGLETMFPGPPRQPRRSRRAPGPD
jgi:transcriptional regulator with XRE-family HTH domain